MSQDKKPAYKVDVTHTSHGEVYGTLTPADTNTPLAFFFARHESRLVLDSGHEITLDRRRASITVKAPEVVS